MKVNSYYPVVTVDDVERTVAFYERHFGFEKGFESDWYVHLVLPDHSAVNLAIMEASHDSLPEGYRNTAQGILLNLEVEDVDVLFEQMVQAKVDILRPLKDEPWGQRHFIMKDPGGRDD